MPVKMCGPKTQSTSDSFPTTPSSFSPKRSSMQIVVFTVDNQILNETCQRSSICHDVPACNQTTFTTRTEMKHRLICSYLVINCSRLCAVRSRVVNLEKSNHCIVTLSKSALKPRESRAGLNIIRTTFITTRIFQCFFFKKLTV